MLQKDKYSLKSPQIEKSFKSIENMLEKADLFQNLQQKRKELFNEINITYQKIETLVKEWKDKKLKEINELFDDLLSNIQDLNMKKKDAKKLLNNFWTKHKNFFELNDKNQDPNNTIFLINYDLLSIPYLWSEQMTQLGKEIEDNMLDYRKREESKDKENVRKIKEILFLSDDEDPIIHEKIDEKYLPLLKLKVDIKDFNGDKLKDL